MTSTSLAERIESKIDKDAMRNLSVVSKGGAMVPSFGTMNEIMEFAKVMAVSDIALPKHLRGNVGACAAIVMQAQNWNMDPLMVANKSYFVNERVAYEAQLIAAVINTRAPIKGRLRVRFEGEGQKRRCIAYATFEGEDEPTEVVTPEIGQITVKNSPLWKSDPDQQLAYYAKRAFARRECPELLLGCYDLEEVNSMVDTGSTSAVAPAAPTREDFAPKVIAPESMEIEKPKDTRKAPPAPTEAPVAVEDAQVEPLPHETATEAVSEDLLAAAEAQGEEDAKAGLARDPETHGIEPGPAALAYLAGWDRIVDAEGFPGDKPQGQLV